ncbi:hypothetical protein AGABI1DRAFT_126415 [Agaricus bisporus var. burnettii JB137-S8]|uniref:Uncharacterized protein n=1 Tax=Agaricus bisporus var. burnettii (strain JB137-S8 / ATCC MYA-4627 / FGSC 10392) TaxID=597362 RepID=K5X2P4_AGABU|nr:uncharacterized protein AGABI1DRAFT_126415 [Agaricus bisporus var. burnettii JB137-S8]EKM82066.1 hypothetical protein AGABI1DRAFT_126415 [Agaricus bisporus var. burnettii JB137-S8]
MSTIECPRCGYDFRAITPDTAGIRPSITPGSVVETEEVLEDEVRRLDEEIFGLNEARASLLRRINNARSKTRHIPPELLTTIFQFVSNPIDFMRSLPSNNPRNGMRPYSNLDDLSRCKMTAVSHSWRRAASSNPQLWSSLSLRVYPSIINASLSLFNRFSRNAGSLPMSIELDFRRPATRSSSPEDRADSLMEPIKKAIFVDYGDRIQCLRLKSFPEEWFHHLKNLDHCDSLAIVRPSYHRRPVKAHLDLTELPRLRHVVLIQVLCPFSLPSTITTLQLRAIPTDISLKLLVTCPRLVKFEHDETEPADERIENVTIFNEPVTIKKLEYLAWSIDYGIWSPRICRGFTFLRFSRLRTLHWSDDIGHKYCDQRRMENNWRLITKFFCHLPTTLSSLTFIRCSYSIEDSRQLLGAIPHLSELHFIDCRVRCVQPVVEAIGRPISQLEQEAIDISTSSDQTLLPNLSHFSLTVTQTTLLNESMGGYIFVDMLEAIHNSGKGQGRFKLSLNHPVSWNENDLDRMRMLESSGFSLELDQAN